jgi:hypothetical protein
MARTRRLTAVCLAAGALAVSAAVAPTADADTTDSHHVGVLRDGGTWVADVPSDWNGTLLLYSHGYGPLIAQDAPDSATQQHLLDAGYALAGSSYDPKGSLWALNSAVNESNRRPASAPQSATVRTEWLTRNPASQSGYRTAVDAARAASLFRPRKRNMRSMSDPGVSSPRPYPPTAATASASFSNGSAKVRTRSSKIAERRFASDRPSDPDSAS